VNVCPTGIDIRNGTQLECINCTACIDACDDMMVNVGLPKGLIKYASEASIAENKTYLFSKKAKAYSTVLGLLVLIFIGLLTFRVDIETTIMRTPGMLYQEQGNNAYSNLYNYKIVNKSNEDVRLTFQVEETNQAVVNFVGENPNIKANETAEGAFFIVLNNNEIQSHKNKIKSWYL
jgi:polyferredoxin